VKDAYALCDEVVTLFKASAAISGNCKEITDWAEHMKVAYKMPYKMTTLCACLHALTTQHYYSYGHYYCALLPPDAACMQVHCNVADY
jgi:hypothetical protein